MNSSISSTQSAPAVLMDEYSRTDEEDLTTENEEEEEEEDGITNDFFDNIPELQEENRKNEEIPDEEKEEEEDDPQKMYESFLSQRTMTSLPYANELLFADIKLYEEEDKIEKSEFIPKYVKDYYFVRLQKRPNSKAHLRSTLLKCIGFCNNLKMICMVEYSWIQSGCIAALLTIKNDFAICMYQLSTIPTNQSPQFQLILNYLYYVVLLNWNSAFLEESLKQFSVESNNYVRPIVNESNNNTQDKIEQILTESKNTKNSLEEKNQQSWQKEEQERFGRNERTVSVSVYSEPHSTPKSKYSTSLCSDISSIVSLGSIPPSKRFPLTLHNVEKFSSAQQLPPLPPSISTISRSSKNSKSPRGSIGKVSSRENGESPFHKGSTSSRSESTHGRFSSCENGPTRKSPIHKESTSTSRPESTHGGSVHGGSTRGSTHGGSTRGSTHGGSTQSVKSASSVKNVKNEKIETVIAPTPIRKETNPQLFYFHS